MKETVNVNIASEAFTLDDDACRVLRNYFDQISRRLPAGDTETMNDIEARVAEILRERTASPMRVVTLEHVRAAMDQMGSPTEFGESRDTTPDPEEPTATPPRKLYRSREDRSLAGVCGGIAEFFHADTTLIRLVTLFMILFGGISIWVYILLWIIIPEAPIRKFDINNKK